MEEELEVKLESNVQTSTTTIQEPATQKALDDLPRIQDLIKSEKEIQSKAQTQTENFEQTEVEKLIEDRVFARKEDKQKIYLKRRRKIVASVFAVVASLLLTFVGVNVATMVILNKEITSNTETIQSGQQLRDDLKNQAGIVDDNGLMVQVSPKRPRDYSDDTKELTFFDKLTILFRNLFS